MLLGGLWHGASWNFVIWGGIHGGMLAFERSQGKQSFYAALPHWLKVTITFVIVCFAWVFFRANDLPSAVRYCASMLGLGNAAPEAQLIGGLIYQPFYLGCLLAAALVTWSGPQTWNFTRRLTLPKALLIIGLFLVAVAALTVQEFNPFIYFIF
jgi:alginate O-acetyltransferase complex protein AlgI